ncbi:hypothetical protein LLG95_02925 [bacterium]|nr:hypothetical protein [bacterium]
MNRLPEILCFALPLAYCAFFAAPARELKPDQAFLGFLHTDQVVYYALAREAFESGNGLVYASPYSNEPASPRIYSHFGFLVMGCIWKATHLPLPWLDYLLRAVVGAAMMLLLVRLFRAALPKGAPAAFGAAAVIALSGIAWLIAGIQFLQDSFLMGAGPPNMEAFLLAFKRVESGYGEWYLNVFGNLTFVHELLFHVLFFGAMLALVRGRAWIATLILFLTWWSHPYTGLQLGLIAGAFLFLEVILGRRAWVLPLLACAFINFIALAYYLLFLPRFPEHASVYEQMRQFSHPMLFSKLLPAYGLFLALPLFFAGAPDFRRLLKESPAARLMLGWLVITAALMFHDRILFFMKPFQPMHFTRGYLFVPLVYFSICALGWLRDRWNLSPGKYAILLAIPFLLQLPDNLIRTAMLRDEVRNREYLYWIPRADLDLLKKIDAVEPTLTIHAVGNGELERMIPVLTHHRAVFGHLYNTPFKAEKTRLVSEFDENLDMQSLRAMKAEALLLPASELEKLRANLGPNECKIVFQQGHLFFVKITFKD